MQEVQPLKQKTYSKFINHVSNMAGEMQDKIIKGDISINPVEGACDYCPLVEYVILTENLEADTVRLKKYH